jgi:hypothetical protein
VQELDGSIMIIVREHVHIGPHVVHHNCNRWNKASMDLPGR